MLIDLDKFIASMIEAFPAFKEEGRIPCMYKEALEAQGLEYKDGEIVKTQRMVSSDVKEDGCGVSENERIRKAIINIFATHKDYEVYFGVSVEDICVWLERQGEQKPIETTWKPSEEQIKILNEILNFAANHESPYWNYYIFGTLNNLIRQLKKLKA